MRATAITCLLRVTATKRRGICRMVRKSYPTTFLQYCGPYDSGKNAPLHPHPPMPSWTVTLGSSKIPTTIIQNTYYNHIHAASASGAGAEKTADEEEWQRLREQRERDRARPPATAPGSPVHAPDPPQANREARPDAINRAPKRQT
jgi:hypothetical protein